MKFNKTTIILHIIAWSVALLWTLPFLGVFMASIRPFSEILSGWWNFDPFNPSLNSFVTAWNDPTYPLSRGILNSFIVVIPSTIIPLFVGALAGYGFARFSFRIRSYLFTTIVEEAARVDGASDFEIFYKIVLPMSLPALASVVVLQFMWVWNDFFLARVFIYEESMLLATQRIEFVGREGPFRVDWGVLSAASIIVMIVPIIIFVLLQRYYVKGMIGWTVKG